MRRRSPEKISLLAACWLALTLALSANGDVVSGDPELGYRLLTEKAYLPADFDQDVDQLWMSWPEPQRTIAEQATAAERRRLTMARYGLTPRPNDPRQRPLQYVVSEDRLWSMNCLACHGGSVNGKVIPGLPNSNYALELLTSEVRKTKLRLGKKLSHMDIGSVFMPLGRTRGTTNAVMFGVALLAYRDDDLQLQRTRMPPRMVHHDMDAPPWWHFREKQYLYVDGFAPKGHRDLMQFMLVEQNGPTEFQAWEDDFRHVYAFLSSLKPPKYSGVVDQELAAAGRQVFAQACAECHGSYEPELDYPERTVAWEVIGTDRVRLRTLTPKHRQRYATSWFNSSRTEDVRLDPVGYVAPPLTGVWASAPYLHNGSVPTLWHLLRPDNRPIVWKRRSSNYDHQRVGLTVSEFDTLPAESNDGASRFEFFDTRRPGKSAAGHTFPAALSEAEKQALLEYLKTL